MYKTKRFKNNLFLNSEKRLLEFSYDISKTNRFYFAKRFEYFIKLLQQIKWQTNKKRQSQQLE
jgi:hypothetical protein